jgi:hypothetical protein
MPSGEHWQHINDLTCLPVGQQEAQFIHQHAGETTRHITVAFGLIGYTCSGERRYL